MAHVCLGICTASLHIVAHVCLGTCLPVVYALPVYTVCLWYMPVHMSALVYALPVYTEWHMSALVYGTASIHRVQHMCCTLYMHQSVLHSGIHTRVQHMSAIVAASACLPWYMHCQSTQTKADMWHMSALVYALPVYTEWHMSALVYALPVYTEWHMSALVALPVHTKSDMCLGICTASPHRVAHSACSIWHCQSTQSAAHVLHLVYALPVHTEWHMCCMCLVWHALCQWHCHTCLPFCIVAVHVMCHLVYALPVYTEWQTCLPLCVYWHCQSTQSAAHVCLGICTVSPYRVQHMSATLYSTGSVYTEWQTCALVDMHHRQTCQSGTQSAAHVHMPVCALVYALPVCYTYTQSGTCLPWYMHCQSTQSGTCLPWYMHCQSTQSGTCLPWYMHCQSTQSGTCLPWYMHCQSTQSGTCLPWYAMAHVPVCQSTECLHSGICLPCGICTVPVCQCTEWHMCCHVVYALCQSASPQSGTCLHQSHVVCQCILCHSV